MHPTAFGIKQTAVLQSNTRACLGLGQIQRMDQIGGKRGGQLRLAFGFLGVERQLQYAAVSPVNATLQVFEQASGMAESADDQLRKGGAVSRQLQIEHALRIARGFLCQIIVTLQQADLPAACSEAGRCGATGQSAADHQCAALIDSLGRASKPRLGGHRCGSVPGPGHELAAQDFPFVADARRAAHLEARGIEQAPYPASAGKGADGRVGCGQARQFGEQFGGPHVRVFRRGETVEEPGVNPGIELRQLFQCIADQQRQRDPAVVQH
ncbi:hypothetical protein D3C84_355220 [compost metagenome]